MKTKVEKVSAKAQEQTIQEQTLPEQNKMGERSESKTEEDLELEYKKEVQGYDDETLALRLANLFLTTDDLEKGVYDPPRRYAVPKEQLTKEGLMSLWKDEIPDEDHFHALHTLETCIDNFPSGYFTDLAGKPIKAQDADQYVVIIYGFDAVKKEIIYYYSDLIEEIRND